MYICNKCKDGFSYIWNGLAYLFNRAMESCTKGKTQSRAADILANDVAEVVHLDFPSESLFNRKVGQGSSANTLPVFGEPTLDYVERPGYVERPADFEDEEPELIDDEPTLDYVEKPEEL